MTVIRLGRARATRSLAEEAFERAWGDRLPAPVREYRFAAPRRWRFDFAWPHLMLALECEGMGRHQRFAGYRSDCEKYTQAALMGWRVLRVMSADRSRAHEWVDLVQRAIAESPIA